MPARRTAPPLRRALKVVPAVLVAAIAAGAAVLEDPGSSRGAEACVTEVARGVGAVESIVLGPDGRMWATDERGDRIVAFDAEDERVRAVPVPRGTRPHRIVGGPDGNLWFTARAGAIGRLNPRSGRVRLYRDGLDDAAPVDLVFNREGDGIFFSDPARGALGHLNLRNGHVSTYTTGLPERNQMHGLAVDLRGNVWAALPGSDRIARFNVRTERFDRFGRFSRGSRPRHVLFFLRGEVIPPLLYATLPGTGKLGEYEDGTGKVTERETGVQPAAPPSDGRGPGPGLGHLVVGADATTVWATTGDDRLVRYDVRQSKVDQVGCGFRDGARTRELALGPAKRIWVTDAGRGSMGRVD